jgi:hypothetical protein
LKRKALDADTKGPLRDIHRRVGTAILFESSGGQTEKVAHLPELRFASAEQIRSELREKMVEFATVMREYSDEVAAKNRAYVEAARNTTDMISSHIEAVRAAMNAVAHEGAPTQALQ